MSQGAGLAPLAGVFGFVVRNSSYLFEGKTLIKRFPFKRQLIILGCILVALCITIPIATFAKSVSGELHNRPANPVSGGALTSGKPVNGVVSTPDGISYTFTAVANKHVNL